jgi:hypothetical protein
MSDVNPVPPGWYPDQNLPGQQRWWDGIQWTDHVQPPYSAAEPFAIAKAPAGTATGTVWIWLIVLLPLLSIASRFLIDVTGYMEAMIANPTSTSAMLSLYTSPGYIATLVLSFVLFALTVVFAWLDVRTLKERGVLNPFHWAFAFLGGIVYTIGRSVVVKRRTGGGLAPLWGMIAVFVVSIIVSIVWSALLVQSMMAIIPVTIS